MPTRPMVTIYFNPRTRTGYDFPENQALLPARLFQSTYPHGVRLQAQGGLEGLAKFQSTYPHGVRPPFPAHVS